MVDISIVNGNGVLMVISWNNHDHGIIMAYG